MNIDSTITVTTYRDLADGDIFSAVKQNGSAIIGMKVATREDRSDAPNHDVLQLSSEQPPKLFSEQFLDGRSVVAKMNRLVFSIPQKVGLLFDLRNDVRARKAVGCVFLIGDDIFLAAEMGNNLRSAGVYFVNVKTGEGWRSIQGRDAVAVPCWQISEVTGGKTTPWMTYAVPDEALSNKVA